MPGAAFSHQWKEKKREGGKGEGRKEAKEERKGFGWKERTGGTRRREGRQGRLSAGHCA